jgi:ATP-binding cassette, subfamily B, bacterial MsbA
LGDLRKLKPNGFFVFRLDRHPTSVSNLPHGFFDRDVILDSLLRLIPFVARHRWALLMSIVLSFGAALFAVAQLSLIFPTMKLLAEQKNWHRYVQDELKVANSTVLERTTGLAAINSRLNDEKWRADHSESELMREQRDRREIAADLRKASWNSSIYSWVDASLLPLIPEDRFDFLAFLLGLLLILTLCKEVCSYFQEMIIGAVVQRVLQSIREQLFRNTLKLDHQTLVLETTPKIMSRFTFDLSLVSHGLTLLGSRIIVEPLKAGICVGCAFALNWRLTLLSFICVPALALLFRNISKKLKKAAQRQMESMSRVYQVLEESLSSIRTVQSYRNERLHRRRLAREHRDYYEKAMRILKIDVLVNPSVEFLAMCAVFAASLPGAYLVLRHKTGVWGIQLAAEEMTVSDLCFLYTCMAGVLDPGRKLSGVYSKLKKSATACTRVFDWIDRASLVKASLSSKLFPRHRESIEFQHVAFHYAQENADQQGHRVLDEISVKIPFGATVAVVGQNGCGKSTFVNMLPRLFDPTSGQVRIDGTDVSEVDVKELRQQIGVVTQETLLFDWSIAENIRYGKPNATNAELHAAAEKAFVTDFVAQLPDGFDTPIGDKGQRLSGGQRQRVALARAIIRDPAILILDEATSAIDTQSEQCIHRSLREFSHNRTTLIVTHAITPSLLDCLTHVIVMDRGHIVAFGPHETVLKTCPLYQRLFEAQTLKRAG